jgi:copper transport protein
VTNTRRWPGSRRPLAWLLVLVCGVLATSAAGPASVDAHALLRSSDPAAGATLGSAPGAVTLTFGETPDVRLTSVHVLDSAGTDHASGPPSRAPDPADSIQVPLDALPDGVYTVTWRTVSAVDGHVSAGTFAFGVGVAPPTGPPGQLAGGTGQSGSPPAVATRWLLYLGLFALLGAAFVALWVARRPVPNLLAMAAVGWVLTAVGTVGVVGVQWAESGAALEDLPGTSIGVAALARAASLGITGLVLAWLAVGKAASNRRGWALVGLAAAAGFAVDVLTGHAAAGADWALQAASQWLHGVTAGAWMGGLAGLLVTLPSTAPEERIATARRFSFWAGIALGIVAVTGAIRAIAEVGTLDALITTDFGRVVLGKSAVLAGVAFLGAFNHFITVRNAARVLLRLRRIGGAELTLALVVVGLSGVLVNLTPPTSAGAARAPVAQPIVATGNDFGTSVRARLVATPGSAGENQFDLALTDYDSGQPIDASAASIRFELASQSGVAPSRLDLEHSDRGRFTGAGSNLSIDGIWKLTATVTSGAGTVEVPLVAATTVPVEPVQQIVSPGLPTIFTSQLGSAGSAQVYLDPGGPGQNELHVTFFDPTGTELPTASATIAVFPAGGPAAILASRLLEPGHFVATVEAVAGPLAVDVISPLPAPATGHVHLHVTIEVTP